MTAALCDEHNIRPEDIDRIEAVVNWLETEYPSPAFPAPAATASRDVGSTQYFSAYGAVEARLPAAQDRPRPG